MGIVCGAFFTAEKFLRNILSINCCPLAFLSVTAATSRRTKLSVAEQTRLFAACDEHLQQAPVLEPDWLIGVGLCPGTGEGLYDKLNIKLGQILHPRPCQSGGKSQLGSGGKPAVGGTWHLEMMASSKFMNLAPHFDLPSCCSCSAARWVATKPQAPRAH